MRSVSHISSISFHSVFHLGDDYIHHFPLNRSLPAKGETGKPSFAYPFRTEVGASRKFYCQPLFSRHFALPFELHACRSLAFEEATGTVCLAVHTGELYILRF
ncbi:hypothetical protein K438DRAFT_1817228 [Mycena galopus ATCC 62051]|nr:hypothetical protein K438DRAFT_1817228 [Mycena galopus ATCC 62051]